MDLLSERYEGFALDGQIRVIYDGLQRVKSVDIMPNAVETAGGSTALAKAILDALQEAHAESEAGTKTRTWQLYEKNSALIQAPLSQIGAGSTAEDLWAKVVKNETSERLANELFSKFDEDGDGYWNFGETAKVQMATEGTEMNEESFKSLVIAAAPDGGRKLVEDDLQKGLSRQQVVELYTDAVRQKQLGFVLDVFKDHAKIFQTDKPASEASETAPAAPAPSVSPLAD